MYFISSNLYVLSHVQLFVTPWTVAHKASLSMGFSWQEYWSEWVAISSSQFSSVQFSHSVVSDSLRLHELQHAGPSCPSPTPPKPMSIKSVMPSNHLILCRPLLLLPSIFPSIRVFSNESALRIRWPKYWMKFQLQYQSFQWTPRADLL